MGTLNDAGAELGKRDRGGHIRLLAHLKKPLDNKREDEDSS